ncbi:hypothetical protein [Rhodocista pekingensis]|uniref:Uncharacterized protein n=1 Tax=Rhodocista pekingensis TaxID=201185 RepID=A0ABW2L0G8_9PROT
MILNLILLLLFVLALVQFAVTLRRMEGDRADRHRATARLEGEHRALKEVCAEVQQRQAQADAAITEAEAELTRLKELRADAEAELHAAQQMPRQRLHMIDRAGLVHQRLWEVTVVNDGQGSLRAGPPPAQAGDWAAGRICLIGAATERDARHRIETRFPSAQGYRIIGVQRFRRG